MGHARAFEIKSAKSRKGKSIVGNDKNIGYIWKRNQRSIRGG